MSSMQRRATSIQCIPLSRTVEEHMVIWMGDGIGEYLVHGGYRSLINNYNTGGNLLHHTEIYKKLWLLDIPAKRKITI